MRVKRARSDPAITESPPLLRRLHCCPTSPPADDDVQVETIDLSQQDWSTSSLVYGRDAVVLANRVPYPVGSLPEFRMWESWRTIPLAGGFSSEISRLPSPFTSSLLHTYLDIILNGSQDLIVKSGLNIFTDLFLARFLNIRATAVHGKMSTFEINLAKMSLRLPAYVLTGARTGTRPLNNAPFSFTLSFSCRGHGGVVIRLLACGNRAVRCRSSAGFLWSLPFPSPFHSEAASYSPLLFTLNGSPDFDVKNRPNHSSSLHFFTSPPPAPSISLCCVALVPFNKVNRFIKSAQQASCSTLLGRRRQRKDVTRSSSLPCIAGIPRHRSLSLRLAERTGPRIAVDGAPSCLMLSPKKDKALTR
ncbi:hypothetical protein PR048_019470 [Dryococelus australis]|uniref:Uncharacterized protein n=1 Tax=Dryococelus australis TaxID=614101 RepID=A0ABQ9H3V6_9NEOP|nr:hypothetical protein PR048_019470 [Dryococelus australis]